MSIKVERTPTVGGTQLQAGQHVHYFLHVEGARAVFSYACTHNPKENPLLNERKFSKHPKADYEWVLQRSEPEKVTGLGDDVLATTLDADRDVTAVGMSYVAAEEYTLRIEKHDANHQVVQMLSDGDYERDVAGDFVDIEVFR